MLKRYPYYVFVSRKGSVKIDQVRILTCTFDVPYKLKRFTLKVVNMTRKVLQSQNNG